MRLFIFMFTLLALISCGKNNSSGKSDKSVAGVSAYTALEEEEFRRDFVRTSQELLNVFDNDLKSMFGPRVVGFIRNRLTLENVQVTEQILMNERNQVVRSYHQNNQIFLYVGHQEQQLDWMRARRGARLNYNRLVLHEMLVLGGVDDQNFRYTDQIMRGRR